jgi:hypothetical protein
VGFQEGGSFQVGATKKHFLQVSTVEVSSTEINFLKIQGYAELLWHAFLVTSTQNV